jgi:hypothetical protein
LLIEESRVNSVSHSSDFQTNWTNTNVLVVPNSSTAPDGTLTATSIVDDTTNGEHTVSRSAYVTVPKARCTLTVFAKPNGLTTFELGTISSTNLARFTLVGEGTATPVTGSTTPAGGGEVFIEKLANGWYRCGFQANYVATITYPYIRLYNSGTSYVGNGSGVYVWGLQMENSALFPTSYIPTSGSTVTRSADLASMTGTNFSSWYTPLENTMSIDFSTIDVSANSKPGLVIYDSTQGSSIRATVEGARAFYYVGTTNYIQVTTRTPQSVRRTFAGDSNYNALGQINKVAQAYAGSTDKGCAINGADPSFTTSASVNPGNVDSMWIGRDENVNTWLNGYISRIACYSVRLSDTQLQALTL